MSTCTIPIVHADASSFDDQVMRVRDELVIVYFFGPQCRNCELFAAQLPALIEELGDVRARLVKVDAYAESELATRFALYGVPAFLPFRDGKRLGRMSSFPGRSEFLGAIRERLPG